MAKEVFMPKTGMDMREGVIVRWHASVGDRVKAGDTLLEIETDKITMDVEAPADGVLLCRYFDDGAVVPVATILAYIGEEGEEVPDRPTMAGGAAREAEEAYLTSGSSRETRGYDYDVAVIGGGASGYLAALRSARLGARTVLFEKKQLGGTCANSGCIPMKTYMHAARMIDEMPHAASHGIHVDEASYRFEMPELYAYKEKVAGALRGKIERLLSQSGVTTVFGEAVLIADHTVRCGTQTFRAGSIILCGGSVTGTLPVDGADLPGVVSPEGLLEEKEIPGKLVVIGGGVIGCETACAYSRFGSEVTIVEQQDALVPTFDREVSEKLRELYESDGIRVLTGKKVDRIGERDGRPVLYLGDGTELVSDRILMSVGRRPNLTALGSLERQISFERGKIMVDDFCRTSIPNIYACGDLTNRSILAHSAMKMGETAAYNACGREKALNLNRAPLCLYSIPEAAGIGLTEALARRRGDILVGRFPFSANGRSVTSGRTDGFVKVIADRGYGEILGVHIVGTHATELIVEAKTMMDMEITVYEVADIMHPHPTRSEAFMEACADAIGECLNLPPEDFGRR